MLGPRKVGEIVILRAKYRRDPQKVFYKIAEMRGSSILAHCVNNNKPEMGLEAPAFMFERLANDPYSVKIIREIFGGHI
jgi:hypothetical protein